MNGTGEVAGIHAFVVDRRGRPAAGIQMNSHRKLFADAKPKTADDCTRVLIDALRIELKRKPPREYKGVG